MDNKVALVTGGTDGVGLSVVKALVKQRFDVYFIGSSESKGKKVEAELKRSAATQSTIVQFIALDLSDLSSVERFARDFSEAHSRLDLILFSAGVLLPTRQTGQQGIEKTLSIGYLSTLVIATTLAPMLASGDNPRIVAISGGKGLVLKERINFDDFNNEKVYIAFKAAIRTVHAKVVLMQWLGDALVSDGVDTISVHPGIVKSGLGQNLPVPLNWMHKLASLVMSRKSESAIHACTSSELSGCGKQHLEGGKLTPLEFAPQYVGRVMQASSALLDQADVSLDSNAVKIRGDKI